MISTNNKIRNENPASTGSLAGSKRIFLHSICSTLLPEMKANNKAVWIFFGGCHVELERRRREYRRAVGTEGVWSGEGMSPSPENFGIFYFKMMSSCECLHGFLFGIFLPFRVMPQKYKVG